VSYSTDTNLTGDVSQRTGRNAGRARAGRISKDHGAVIPSARSLRVQSALPGARTRRKYYLHNVFELLFIVH